ncbi:MFS transporter [Cohaesibacter intestini]|uniref:MFS transporter n=1 Tax=Cohaesibacter intestini TaxID=2211145 RepID=UPI000DEA325E|nr:MFS transporter [Cohaesibacter intestini]
MPNAAAATLPAAKSFVSSPEPQPFIRQGTRSFTKVACALFLAGFNTFALLYCVQPLLPMFAEHFHVTPATSSLALSLCLACLALSIMVLGAVSQQLGRKGVMLTSMLLASALNMAAAIAPGWHGLLIARAFEGLALGGLPAVAMAYLAEEIHPDDLPKAMGIYVGGTAFGAMLGRVGLGLMTEFVSWQEALQVMGVLTTLAALGFAFLLPPSTHFEKRNDASLTFHLSAWRAHLRNPSLMRLYLIGFCLTGVFSTVYNYLSFRLFEAPYHMGPFAVSLIFLLYLIGTLSSSVSGTLIARFGQRKLLMAAFSLTLMGLGVTLFQPLVLICVGVGLITTGFFVGHSVVSGAVGLAAEGNKGHASSLYLLFYYVGASFIGYLGGWFWHLSGWSGLAGLTACLALMALTVSSRVGRPS